MRPVEQTLSFECQGETLLGVLALPSPERVQARADVGVLIVVGGPQYRSGSHRQFVLLARSLASEGYPTLRFDVRGMGDSGGDRRDFEAISDDIGAAIGALVQAQPRVARIVLWGLCDGASAALLYCAERQDVRVQGLCLANPWLRSEATQARTQINHYYRQRLQERAFWLKLFSGKVAVAALRGLWQAVRRTQRGPSGAAPGFQARMCQGWSRSDMPKLLLLSGQDYTAKEFDEYVRLDPAWARAVARSEVERREIPGADHTFSISEHRQQVEAATLRWLDDLRLRCDAAA